MKKSDLRQLIRQMTEQQFSKINKTSTSIVKQQPTMRGFAGDDDGFIDDDTLYNQVIPNAIKYAIHDAIQYNDKI